MAKLYMPNETEKRLDKIYDELRGIRTALWGVLLALIAIVSVLLIMGA